MLWTGQCAHARRGELDRERDAVEPTADVDDGRRVLLGQAEIGLRGHRAIHEKAYRRKASQCGRRDALCCGSGTASAGSG